MKYMLYNVVALAFIGLAALFVIKNKDGWGWCIFGAICSTVFPSSEKVKKEN